jgi:formylmethanofuran dehydrogenase subunit E
MERAMRPQGARRRKLLKKCVGYHGHLCNGQILGVRIALKGMELAGTDDPHELIVFVENDRCIGDAVQIVTGTRLGRRSFKLRDVGKMAAVFYNCETKKAWRVWVAGNLDKIAKEAGVGDDDEKGYMFAALDAPDEKLLGWKPVRVRIPANEMPGKPKRVVNCVRCGERVMDGKDVKGPKGPMCRSCRFGAYYEEMR